MCKKLKISRSAVYYSHKEKKTDTELENMVIEFFNQSKENYGTRKIRESLKKKDKQVSKRKIARIMRKYSLVSNYTQKKFKTTPSTVNNEKIENIVNRDFNRDEFLEVVVSDLTYVQVGNNWNYICKILDLSNREIIGYACGQKKDANLVLKAFSSIKYSLDKIMIFHTDRGNEFKNNSIDGLLKTFKIDRSLSRKGTPYDNAVAEATFKVIKTEFIYQNKFKNLLELEIGLMDYVNWYNNIRLHGSLNYMTPVGYRKNMSE